MTTPTKNEELYTAFMEALKTDGATPEEAQKSVDNLKEVMAHQAIRNPMRLAQNLSKLSLPVGDTDVLIDVLGIRNVQQTVAAPAISSSAVPQTLRVQMDKAPHELREHELLALFADPVERDNTDVIQAMRARFRDRRIVVLNEDGTIALEDTFQRRREEDDGDVYNGKVVATVDEALERNYAADPLDGGKLNKVYRASDGVKWPESDDARRFLIYCRRLGLGGVQANSHAPYRHALAEAVKSYPANLPGYLADPHVKYVAAVRKKDPEIFACDAEMRCKPTRHRREATRNGTATIPLDERPGMSWVTRGVEGKDRQARIMAALTEVNNGGTAREALEKLNQNDINLISLNFFPHVRKRIDGLSMKESIDILTDMVSVSDIQRAIRASCAS
jgi:hypothetical protein